MPKITREKFKVYEGVFDNFTIKNLIALMKKGIVSEGTLSPVKIGKEANVFSGENDLGEKLILKIYRLETANFNRMYEYIRTDPRFVGLLHNRRRVIFAWVQREYRNLIVAEKANIPAPRPIKALFNILAMSFIGDNSPAPMLKDAPPRRPREFLNRIVRAMRNLYRQGYVHGDLSKFNILNYNQKPVLIDFSHATPNTNPIFKQLLERDARVISEDFREFGVDLSMQEILRRVIK